MGKPCVNDMIEILKTGSIEKVKEIYYEHFHKIKHTISFGVLINRLEQAEKLESKLLIVLLNLIKAYNNAEGEMWIPDYVEPVLKNEVYPLLEEITGKTRQEIEKELTNE